MHYQVRLHGTDRREEYKLVLEDHPMRNLKSLHLAPGRQLDLQVCYAPNVYFFHGKTEVILGVAKIRNFSVKSTLGTCKTTLGRIHSVEIS